MESKTTTFLKPIGKLFARFHMTISIVLLIGGLTGAVLLLANILNDAAIDDAYVSPISAGSIDQATLDRINALHTSDGTFPEPIPYGGRISPFTE